MKIKNNILLYLISLYIIILPIMPNKLSYLNLPASAPDLLLGIILCVYLFKIVFNKKSRENFIKGIYNFLTNSLNIFMFMLLAIMFISVSYSLEKSLAVRESIRFLSYVAIYFIIKYEIKSKRATDIMLSAYVGICFILSSIGIVQYFTGIGLNKKFISDYSFGAKIRIASTMENPNTFAAFIMIGILAITMLGIINKNKIGKAFLLITSVLMFINLLLTESRSAMVGLAVGCLVLMILYSWKLIMIFGPLGIISLLIPQIRNRIMQITDYSQNESRIKLYKTAFKMIQDHPIFGVGNGNYVSWYDYYINTYKGLGYNSYKRYPAHNSYLKVQSELGIIGTVSFLGIIITALMRVFKFIKITTEESYKYFYIGFMASCVGFIFMNLTDNLFFVPKAIFYFWLLLCIADTRLLYGKRDIFGG